MKKKAIHYKSVHISTDSFGTSPNVHVKVGTFFYNEQICEFWVPRSCLEYNMVPSEIIKARLKHDFNITIDHYSYGSI